MTTRGRKMRAAQGMRWPAATGGLLVLLAAACGGGAQGTAPGSGPEGSREAGVGQLRYSVPADWEEAAEDADGWEGVFESHEDGVVTASLGTFTGLPAGSDARLGRHLAMAQFQVGMEYRKTGEDEDLEVPGARNAYRVDYTFTPPEGADDRARGVDIAVAAPDDSLFVWRLTGLEGHLEDELVEQLAASLRVED